MRDVLSEARADQTPAQIARTTALPTASVVNYLRFLEQGQMIQRSPEGAYRITTKGRGLLRDLRRVTRHLEEGPDVEAPTGTASSAEPRR